jgi:hypothetical protein
VALLSPDVVYPHARPNGASSEHGGRDGFLVAQQWTALAQRRSEGVHVAALACKRLARSSAPERIRIPDRAIDPLHINHSALDAFI